MTFDEFLGPPIDYVHRYAFWRDGCEMLVRYCRDLLRLAGEPVTTDNVIRLVTDMPRCPTHLTKEWRDNKPSYWADCASKAYEAHGIDAMRKPMDFFCVYFLKRSDAAQFMLTEGVTGVLLGLSQTL
jgi:hypothetical protein